VNPSAEL